MIVIGSSSEYGYKINPMQETDRLEAAHETNVWNPKPNFTCRKFCLVKECEHNGRGHYR